MSFGGFGLREILKAAEYGAGLCRQLLVFSRGGNSESRVTCLNLLVLEMDAMLRRLIGEDIDLVTRPRPELGLAAVDPDKIEQVLVNLVLNARDAMPGGGRLTTETANLTLDQQSVSHSARVPAGEYVVLSISDTGTGIGEDVLPHIFEPFFRTKDRDKGTGLGLFTCYGIISQSGGFIDVRSEPGEGTMFEVYLPRNNGPIPSEIPNDEPDSLPRGTEIVLLVEDEQVVREVAAAALRAQGYTVLEAVEGVEALSLAREHAGGGVDLLFTDLIMPLMGGRELAMRLSESHPGVRVLYTSGYADNTAGEVESHRPGEVFIDKPFTPAALARKVRAVLDS